MKTIIAPTDFSDASVHAVQFAADLAMAVNAELQIYHAATDKVVFIDNLDYDLEDAETEEVLAKLETLQAQISSYTSYRLKTTVQLKYGNIDRVLEEQCKHAPPFAVVMSATEKTGLERFLLGSESLSVSHRIQVPLILVPPAAVFKGFNKVTIATDLHEVYDSMPLDALSKWIEAFKPALEIVYVQEEGKFKANNVSEAVALQTHFGKYYPALHYISSGNIAAGINNYLDNAQPDLLIVIPKKHHFFHKSISKQFIIHPTTPTMILSNHHQ